MHSVAPRDHPAGLIDAQPDLAYGRGATGALYLARAVGRMAEWLCRGLQILVRRFDSASGLHFLKAQLISLIFLPKTLPPEPSAELGVFFGIRFTLRCRRGREDSPPYALCALGLRSASATRSRAASSKHSSACSGATGYASSTSRQPVNPDRIWSCALFMSWSRRSAGSRRSAARPSCCAIDKRGPARKKRRTAKR
jgi:hypothetical protein